MYQQLLTTILTPLRVKASISSKRSNYIKRRCEPVRTSFDHDYFKSAGISKCGDNSFISAS